MIPGDSWLSRALCCGIISAQRIGGRLWRKTKRRTRTKTAVNKPRS